VTATVPIKVPSLFFKTSPSANTEASVTWPIAETFENPVPAVVASDRRRARLER
jgi:hypothetical protein